MTEGDISMKTAIVTDSNCGISIEEAKGMSVFIIPMPVYIPMSSGLSGSFHTACQIAMEFPGRVHVVDARRISVTQRHAVQDALWLASRGMDASTIKERLERNALNSVVFVGVDDIDYLKRGGRITSAAAAMASVLNIKPLLIIGGNRIDAYEKVRGQKCSISSHVGPNSFGMGISAKIEVS